MTIELKRSPTLVMYWRDDRLLLHNYAVDRTVVAQPLVVEVLEAFHAWRPLEDYLSGVRTSARGDLSEVIEVMVQDRWLRMRDEPLLAGEREMERWNGWNPAAGFFHTATRNPEIVGLDGLLPQLSEQAKSWAMPPAAKSYQDVATVQLPRPASAGEFAGVLRARRTWRRFGAQPVALEDLADTSGSFRRNPGVGLCGGGRTRGAEDLAIRRRAASHRALRGGAARERAVARLLPLCLGPSRTGDALDCGTDLRGVAAAAALVCRGRGGRPLYGRLRSGRAGGTAVRAPTAPWWPRQATSARLSV